LATEKSFNVIAKSPADFLDFTGHYLEYDLRANPGTVKQVHYLEYGLEANPGRIKQLPTWNMI